MLPPSEIRKQEALARFRTRTDTREDRDVLRSYRITGASLLGGQWREVPTVEEEEAKPESVKDKKKRAAPQVWNMSRPRLREDSE